MYVMSQKAHDEALRTVFQRLKDSGLTLNRGKFEFNKHRLEFFGFIFSANGISADPKKVAAIQHASEPKDPGEIRSLLGMANYCSWFIKDFSTITAPLRELTKKDTPWLLSQMQNGQKYIIAYASHALSDVEKRNAKL